MNDLGMAPRWGSAFTRVLGAGVLRLLGWKMDVQLPHDEPHLVITAAPHTSNWDGILAVAAILALGIRVNFFAKDSLFRWPFRGLLTALGGVPIRRDAARGIVEQTADLFASKPRLFVGVAPEGTRSRAPIWKSGFYRIAMASGAPILLAYIDYERRRVGTGPLIRPSGNYEADLAQIQAFYRTIKPRHPQDFAAEA
ncbi:acyltransferase-like protein [Panacagrimonas perspica]|uniref:Acyltransferase-like protein n=1 Tax=Panacagrimonas perspica TaxID=381431 RepID=A0A4R7NT87_9GAMM|nr:lysophospholipid acyltransferase family protein [Panacagrimonas perspica]TDU24283.1 acyltransferase-like protein [Panacagrimonas perspica]